MKPPAPTDLRFATDQELWLELRSRYIGAIMVYDDARGVPAPVTRLWAYGSRAHLLGLLHSAIEAIDGAVQVEQSQEKESRDESAGNDR